MESKMRPGFERLFLLEFMVHKVRYDCATVMDRNFLKTLGATCVSFVSDSLPLLEMSEDEFGVRPPYDSLKVKFKNGKSCLFALKGGSEVFVGDKAQITISRRLPPGGCSQDFTFGKAYLKMSPEFLSVLSSSSSSKCLKVSLDILNSQMEIRGTIDILLRLSCFGTAIVTQFQSDSSSEKNAFAYRGHSILLPNVRNTSFTWGMGPQSHVLSGLAPNMSEKAKNDLIIDLLKVIKSSSMLNYLLKNQSLPTGDQILPVTGIPPTNTGNAQQYDQQYSETNYVRAIDNPNLIRFPNFNTTSRDRMFNNVSLSSPLEYHQNILKPFISQENAPVKNLQLPNMLTYEAKGTISTVSENILCKPENRLKKILPSEIKVLKANTSSSRNSISKPIWYSPGGSNALLRRYK